MTGPQLAKDGRGMLLIAFWLMIVGCSRNTSQFGKLDSDSDWKLTFADSGTGDWQEKWFLDGLKAEVKTSNEGMNFAAGPQNRDDAHHAVLWTKKSFEGDVKIQYNYTRTDSQNINVNILFIQASGTGIHEFSKDITLWNKYREIPTMSKYYYNMDPLHLSYAAFPTVNEDPENDYVRVRKYPAEEGKFGETEILPTFFKTGLFLPYVEYSITVIKSNSKLYFKVEGDNRAEVFSWDLLPEQSPSKGRIGLRHMYTRSARYSDFRVFVKATN